MGVRADSVLSRLVVVAIAKAQQPGSQYRIKIKLHFRDSTPFYVLYILSSIQQEVEWESQRKSEERIRGRDRVDLAASWP